MQDSQQRFRTWGSNIEIFRDEADFKALLIIERSCTHLLTLAASLYGRTWQQSRAALLSGTSLCSNTGQSLSFTEKINVKLRDHLWWKSEIPVFVVSHTNCPEMFTHIILTVASLQIQSHLNEHIFLSPWMLHHNQIIQCQETARDLGRPKRKWTTLH